MKRYIFKRSGVLQGNATYWKGIFFLLKECYTLWMKVSVCKACSCHLELVKRRMHVWSSLVVNYSVFTALFRFGEKTQSWMIFLIWVESLLKGNFAERLRYLEVRKLYLRHSLERVRTKRSWDPLRPTHHPKYWATAAVQQERSYIVREKRPKKYLPYWSSNNMSARSEGVQNPKFMCHKKEQKHCKNQCKA